MLTYKQELTEARLTTAPLPRSRMYGSAAWIMLEYPMTLVCRTCIQISGVTVSKRPNQKAAALLT